MKVVFKIYFLTLRHLALGPVFEINSFFKIFFLVYNAVGLAAYELFDSVDFDQWFKNQLLPELQVIHNRQV